MEDILGATLGGADITSGAEDITSGAADISPGAEDTTSGGGHHIGGHHFGAANITSGVAEHHFGGGGHHFRVRGGGHQCYSHYSYSYRSGYSSYIQRGSGGDGAAPCTCCCVLAAAIFLLVAPVTVTYKKTARSSRLPSPHPTLASYPSPAYR